ncbi:MAG TPA: archease [Candidatus Nanoarchaeia archaeon]|nr:archease [Candidatus Nanoarchaeia archaeon]
MPKYKFLEDIALADIAYEAYGKNLNELFENAALAIFELSAELKTVDAKKSLKVNLKHKNLDNLLYDFLSEILYLKDAKYVVFKEVKVTITEGKINKLSALLKGDRINSGKQHLENDIKAVTMHLFELKKEKKGYKARIVVDI